MKIIKIDSKILKIVRVVIKSAIAYEKEIGRKLGITGEVGEVLVCDRLKLKLLADPLSSGYDALDKKGSQYQIKTIRKVDWNRRYLGNVGNFGKHKFDYAILGLLDSRYILKEIYKTDYKTLKPILIKNNFKIKIRKFRSISKYLKK